MLYLHAKAQATAEPTNLMRSLAKKFKYKRPSGGEVSANIWCCYSKYEPLSLLIPLEIHCFHGLSCNEDICIA